MSKLKDLNESNTNQSKTQSLKSQEMQQGMPVKKIINIPQQEQQSESALMFLTTSLTMMKKRINLERKYPTGDARSRN
jgi:hypothetical protein